MTARYNALIVTLDCNLRTDDAEPLMNAIRQLKGVASVDGNVSDINSHIAWQVARSDLAKKLWDVLYGKSE